jgi:hypothetical protein
MPRPRHASRCIRLLAQLCEGGSGVLRFAVGKAASLSARAWRYVALERISRLADDLACAKES